MSPQPPDLTPDQLDAAVRLLGDAGGGGTLRVEGASMAPLLPGGQRVAVDFAPGRLRRGDLLVFRQADHLAVHRLLGRGRAPDGRRCLRTRGDGVTRLDPPLDPRGVLGRVTSFERGGGWWAARSPGARVYGLALALHDLAWAAAAALAERMERRRGVEHGPSRWRARVARCDRRLLRLTDRLLFRVCHRRVPAPAESPSEPRGRGPGAAV